MSQRMMRVLVCGGREFSNWSLLESTLEEVSAEGPCVVIQGGASGADSLAKRWAEGRGMAVETYVAYWDVYGRAAGPIRNQRMLDEGKPDLVISFEGGRGTADMVRRARVAGIKLLTPR